MPMLLELIAHETASSNRRLSQQFDDEARQLERQRQFHEKMEDIRRRSAQFAGHATDFVNMVLARADGFWRSALDLLRGNVEPKEQIESLLNQLIESFTSGEDLVQACRSLWAVAEGMGIRADRLDELEKAASRFSALAREARIALDHRIRGWQPSDQKRLEQGLELAHEGQAIKAEDARARFRRKHG